MSSELRNGVPRKFIVPRGFWAGLLLGPLQSVGNTPIARWPASYSALKALFAYRGVGAGADRVHLGSLVAHPFSDRDWPLYFPDSAMSSFASAWPRWLRTFFVSGGSWAAVQLCVGTQNTGS